MVDTARGLVLLLYHYQYYRQLNALGVSLPEVCMFALVGCRYAYVGEWKHMQNHLRGEPKR
jgi:hypothetical protein